MIKIACLKTLTVHLVILKIPASDQNGFVDYKCYYKKKPPQLVVAFKFKVYVV